MRAWLDNFDRSFVGLWGTEQRVRDIGFMAGVPPAIKQTMPDGSLGGYGVGHGAQVIAFTADDSAHVEYPFGVGQDIWVHDLPILVNGKWSR
jgi:protein SCO1/2